MACFKFLALPGELRNMIYRFALTTDPPDMEREHKYNCKMCTWNPYHLQKPMWWYDKRIPVCRCWARSGLALLLANRQIYWEGAAIFWAENHFTFWGVESFIDLVGTRLRPQWRHMLRSISVYCAWDSHFDPLSHTHDRFPSVLFGCKGLRKLEIELNINLGLFRRRPTRNRPDVELAAWEDFKRLLPKLNVFTVARFWAGRIKSTSSLDIKALPAEKIKEVCDASGSEPDIIRGLYSWVLYGTRPSFPSSVEILEATRSPHVYACSVLVANCPVRFTMQQYLQPLSPETIARNRALREADRVRRRSRRNGLRKMYGWEERLRPRDKRTTTPPEKAMEAAVVSAQAPESEQCGEQNGQSHQ